MNFYNTNDVCITINSIPYKNFSSFLHYNKKIVQFKIDDKRL